MKKSLLSALLLAVVLFVYGYIALNVGHDHASHSESHHEDNHDH